MQWVRPCAASVALSAAFLLACSSPEGTQRLAVPSSDQDVQALKPPGTNAIIVHAIGYGTGTITISDPTQTCVTYEWGEGALHYSQVCWAYVPVATTSVTVTAAANIGSQLTGWSGPCAGADGGTCTVPMDVDRIINVGLWPKPPDPGTEYALNVHVLGFVDGEISAPPGVGLVCQPYDNSEDVASVRYARTCTATVPVTTPPTEVVLTAAPLTPGTHFAGWGGSCAGTGTCTVTMDRDVGITASFVRTAPLVAVVDVDRADPTTGPIAGILNVSRPATPLTVPGQGIGVVPGRNLLLGLDASGRVVHLAIVFGSSWSSTELGTRTTVQALFLSALAGVVEDARGAELASAWLVDQPEFPQVMGAAEALVATRGYLDASAPEASTLLGLLTSITERLAQSVMSDGALASSSAALVVASSGEPRQVGSLPLVASSAALTSTLGYLLPKGIRIDWSPRDGSCTSGDMTFQNPNPHFTRVELSTELGPLAVPSSGYTLIAPYDVVPDASVSGLVSFVHSWIEGAFAGNLGFESTTVAIEVPRSARTLNVAAVDADVRSILANVIVDTARATSLPVSGEMLGSLVEGALLLVDVERASRQFEADRDVARFVRAVARPTAMYVVSRAEQWLTSGLDRFLSGQPLAMVGAQVGLFKTAFYVAILASHLSTDSSAALSTSALFGVACAAGTTPALSVIPATGPKGTSHAVSGTGFTPNGRVEMYLQMPDGTVSITAVTSDAQGTFVWGYDSTAADQYGQFTCWGVDVASGRSSAAVSFDVTREATIDEVTFSSTVVTIDLPSYDVYYRTTLTNHTPATMTNIALQGWIEQGSARRAAGGAVVLCGAGDGTLPSGTCQDGWFPRPLLASNSSAGAGTLVPGPALAVIELRGWSSSGAEVVLDSSSTPITLIAAVAPNAPVVSVSPSAGVRGTVFSQGGLGFTPGGAVVLHFRRPDGTELSESTTADLQGSYTWSYDSSTAVQHGLYGYWAVDVASGQTSNSVTFEIVSNATWTIVPNPNDDPLYGFDALYGVGGASADRVWAVGHGVILAWDGTRWTIVGGGSQPYYATWGLSQSPNDFWVFSTYRQAYRCDLSTSACTTASFPGYWSSWYLYDLVAAWGSAPDDVWAVDTYGNAIRWDGTTWAEVGTELNDRWWQTSYGTWFHDRWPLYGIWGSAANDVWAVGYNGAVVHWDGLAWSETSRPTSSHLHGIWGSAANDVWAVGAGGTILHWDGGAWSIVPSDTTRDLMAVWGSSANDVWAVGASGTATHWDGAGWKSATIGPDFTLRSVWGTSAGDVWAVGDHGTILHYQ